MKSKDIQVLLVGLILVGMVPSVMALVGPAQSLPFGLNVVDSDPGGPDDKEQWGRAGGRTFTFNIFQIDQYAQLKWQPIGVGIAFDDAIDEGGEILTLDSTGVGTAVWTGNTTVEVLDENTGTYQTVAVNTEFILTVKDSGNSLISFETFNGLPTVNIKTLTPALFTATLEMRAQMPSYDSVTAICPYASPTVGQYYPALDVFDCLQTNPAFDRPAISRFEYGFFYEYELDDPNSLLELAEHDAYMEELIGGVQTSVDNIYMWTNFLFTDWPLRISGINDAHAQTNDNFAIIGGTLDEINTKVDSYTSNPEEVLNKLNNIDESVSKIPDFNLLMFGLTDFIQDEELKQYVPMVIASSPVYQKLDALNETCTQISAEMLQYADIIASLTTQLGSANQQVIDLTEVMGSMYTEEQLNQLLDDACPGQSEDANFGKPPK